MAGEHIETGAHGSEGSSGAAPSLAASRAATLAALEAGEHMADAKSEKPAAVVEESEKDDADEDLDDQDEVEDDDAEEVSDEDDDTDEDDEESDDEDDEEVDAAKEPDLAKRLDQVRRAERRSKEAIARDRGAFEKERDAFVSEWKPRVEAAAKFEKLQGKVRHNLVDVLTELGVNVEDDGEEMARELYAHSKKGGADPNNKAAVARSRRERELMDEVRDLKKRVEDRESNEKQTAAQRTQAEQTQKYVTSIAKAAGESQPLIKKLLTTDAARAHGVIAAAAIQLLEKTGEKPSRTRVLALAEKKWRRELVKIGADPDAIAKSPAAVVAKKAAVVAGKKTETKKVEAATVPKTLKEQRAETLRKLEANELD